MPARWLAAGAAHRRLDLRARPAQSADHAHLLPDDAERTPATRCSRAIDDPARRATLVAEPAADGYEFDIRIQGDGETVFFESDEAPAGLFDGVLARGPVREAVGDAAWLQAMLDVEAALARAKARAGLITARAADAIGRRCRRGPLRHRGPGSDAAEPATRPRRWWPHPRPGRRRRAADAVHHGATSQDVLDTASSLVSRRALVHLCGDLHAASRRGGPACGRASPDCDGGSHASPGGTPDDVRPEGGRLDGGLDAAIERLVDVAGTRLAVQLGGAVGTLASFGTEGLEVAADLADDLELAEPTLAWHTERTRVAELAGALGEAAGAIGKAARDVILLAQTEVGEVREGTKGRGGSSTLPHKSNPIAAVSALACAMQAPGLVATLFAAMVQEHERAAGPGTRSGVRNESSLSASARARRGCVTASSTCGSIGERMHANLEPAGGVLLAERVVGALAPAIGRELASEVVSRAAASASATGRAFADVLAEDAIVREAPAPGTIGRAAGLRRLPGQHGPAHRPCPGSAWDGQGTARGASAAMSATVAVHHVEDGPAGAPVVVLAHALGTSLEMWEPQVASLARHFRVVRYDARGHGSSPLYRTARTSSATLAATCCALLDELGIARAHVVGLSLGAMVGLWVAAHVPDRVDRLVACSVTARPPRPEAWRERAAAVRSGGTRAVVDLVVERWGYVDRAPAICEQVVRMLLATPAEGYAGSCEAIATMNLEPDVPSMRAPTLLISGASDPAAPPATNAAMAATMPDAGVSVVDAAHLLNAEQPDAVTRLILDHLLGTGISRRSP